MKWEGITKSRLFVPAALGLAALAAFAVRAYFMRYHPLMVPDYDGADYLNLARNVFRGGPFYHIFIPPGFPALLSLALPLFSEPQTAGMFVSAFFGSTLVIAVFLFARELYGVKTAFAAALLTAFFGELVQVSTWVMSEMPFAFLLYLGLYLAAVFQRRRDFKTAAAMGAVFGFGYLVRPEALIFLAGVCAALLASELLSGRGINKGLLAGLAAAGIIALAIAFPYLLYLRRELGHWSISGKVLYNLSSDHAAGNTAGYLGGHLQELFGKYLANFPLLLKQLVNMFTAPVLLLALAGMLLSAAGARRSPLAFLLPALLAGYVLLLPLFFIDERILTPYLPAILLYSAYPLFFLEEAASKIKNGAIFRFHPAAAFFVLVFSVLQISWLYSFLNSSTFFRLTALMKERYVNTGEWLQCNTPPGEKILSRELLLVFYSGRDYINLPDISPAQLASFAREKGARYVIADDSCLGKRKNLGPLLDPWLTGDFYKSYDGFRPVYADPAAGVLVYEVEDRI